MTDPLVHAATQLADLLEQENRALAACDLRGAAAMLDAKQKATAAFGTAIGQPATAGPALRPIAARLAATAAENRRLLERSIAIQGRVLAIVARAAPLPSPAARYGAPGARPTASSGSAPPVALLLRA